MLLAGKHDRVKHTPYSALLDALRTIVNRLLMMSRDDVQWWRDTLMEAISPNGKVLVDVIPEVEVIIGPQPPVPILPPSETKTRFERVLVLFLQVFLSKCTAVLFLDGI